MTSLAVTLLNAIHSRRRSDRHASSGPIFALSQGLAGHQKRRVNRFFTRMCLGGFCRKVFISELLQDTSQNLFARSENSSPPMSHNGAYSAVRVSFSVRKRSTPPFCSARLQLRGWAVESFSCRSQSFQVICCTNYAAKDSRERINKGIINSYTFWFNLSKSVSQCLRRELFCGIACFP
jgi:hypothetical protein